MDVGQLADVALFKGYCANGGDETASQIKTACRLPILFFGKLKYLILILKPEYNNTVDYDQTEALEKRVVECYERQRIQDVECCVPQVGIWFYDERHMVPKQDWTIGQGAPWWNPGWDK